MHLSVKAAMQHLELYATSLSRSDLTKINTTRSLPNILFDLGQPYLGVVRLRVEVSGAHGGVEHLNAVRVAPVEAGVQVAHFRGNVHHF